VKSNIVKRKLRAGEPSYGTWISLANLLSVRTLARMGFDWLTLDIEHQAIDWQLASTLMAAIADAGCVPLARVPSESHETIKRTLDAGAYGIVVPMVDTVEQARAAVAAAKYPPAGKRSLGGGMHYFNFGTSPDEYYRQANDEILIILQTESPMGVENAREIYSVPGVDGIFVGPVDLRANMVSPDGRQPSDEQFEELISRVVSTGREVGTPTGMHVMDVAAARQRSAQGMQFIAVGSDLRMLVASAQPVVEQLLPEAARRDVARY